MLGLSLYAWDTFPLDRRELVRLRARVHARADGRRFPGGHFYRPLVELSFAVDHALWGLDAARLPLHDSSC